MRRPVLSTIFLDVFVQLSLDGPSSRISVPRMRSFLTRGVAPSHEANCEVVAGSPLRAFSTCARMRQDAIGGDGGDGFSTIAVSGTELTVTLEPQGFSPRGSGTSIDSFEPCGRREPFTLRSKTERSHKIEHCSRKPNCPHVARDAWLWRRYSRRNVQLRVANAIQNGYGILAAIKDPRHW